MSDPPDHHTALGAQTPEQLFGEAVNDARALKRRYAVLIRAFRPEDDSVAFRHIRAPFELAKAAPATAEETSSGPPSTPVSRAICALRRPEPETTLRVFESDVTELPDELAQAVARAIGIHLVAELDLRQLARLRQVLTKLASSRRYGDSIGADPSLPCPRATEPIGANT